MKLTVKKLINLFFVVITTTIMSSCVGTLKDANSKDSKVLDTGDAASPISFSGLIQANPIAHNKVELFFFPYHHQR